jgi:hypothetical protein
MWTGFIWLRIGTGGGLLSTRYTLCPIKGEKFLDKLSDCQLLKDCAPWSNKGQQSFAWWNPVIYFSVHFDDYLTQIWPPYHALKGFFRKRHRVLVKAFSKTLTEPQVSKKTTRSTRDLHKCNSLLPATRFWSWRWTESDRHYIAQ